MLCGIAMMGLSACSDFFEPDNNTMLKGDDYIKEASEMYAGFLGVATKMQAYWRQSHLPDRFPG